MWASNHPRPLRQRPIYSCSVCKFHRDKKGKLPNARFCEEPQEQFCAEQKSNYRLNVVQTTQTLSTGRGVSREL